MALAPISPLPPLASVSAISAPTRTEAAASAPSDSASGFVGVLNDMMATEQQANKAAASLATGELADVHQFTAAAAKAQLTVELASAVRNRAVDAFNEVMRITV